MYRLATKRIENKKAELSQRWPCDAPNIWVLWKKIKSPAYQTATFPEICNGLLFRSTLRMCVQNWKFVALPVPEIIGVLKKFRQSLDTPTLSMSVRLWRWWIKTT